MLSLHLHPDDLIQIGENIEIKAIKSTGCLVRVYINAPKDIPIKRVKNDSYVVNHKTKNGSRGGPRLRGSGEIE
jgi:sRNA-binding carbon storage regulator CsrA